MNEQQRQDRWEMAERLRTGFAVSRTVRNVLAVVLPDMRDRLKYHPIPYKARDRSALDLELPATDPAGPHATAGGALWMISSA